MPVEKSQQFLQDEDGQLHFNFPGTAEHISRMSRRRSFDLQPHEMSPEEFVNHPDTLFHSSNESHIEGFQPFNATKSRYSEDVRDYADYPDVERRVKQGEPSPTDVVAANYTHAGSERAAYARADGYMASRTHIHAVHVPNKEFGKWGITDEAANAWYQDEELNDYMDIPNDHPDKDPLGNTPWYYFNTAEDTTSASAVIPRSRALTHSDYVKQALEQGKGDEIHPETLRRYQNGTLSSVVETLDSDQIDRKFKDPDISAQLKVGGDLFTGVDPRHSVDEIRRGLYKFDEQSANVSYGYPKRVYSRGPYGKWSNTLPLFESKFPTSRDNSWIDYKPEDEKNG
jgi:hypothetical protein